MRERQLRGKLLSFIQLSCLTSGVIFFTEISRELDARAQLKERLLSTTASDLGSIHNYLKPFPTNNERKGSYSVQHDFNVYRAQSTFVTTDDFRMNTTLPVFGAVRAPHTARSFAALYSRDPGLAKATIPILWSILFVEMFRPLFRRLQNNIVNPLTQISISEKRSFSTSKQHKMLHHLMVGTWTPPGAIFTFQFDDEALTLKLIKRTEIPKDEPISWMTFDVCLDKRPGRHIVRF